MHRLIMLSRDVPAVEPATTTANAAIDPDNDYLWRFNRRRLDAESIRDALLAVSGNLDRSPGGPHPFPEQTTWNFTQHKPFKAVYDTQPPQRLPDDAAHPAAPVPGPVRRRRHQRQHRRAAITSTTPLQALFLMNDPFVHEQAAEVRRPAAGRAAGRRRRGSSGPTCWLFGRPADGRGTSRRRAEYLAQVAREAAVDRRRPDSSRPKRGRASSRALFLSNEFVYVD